MHRDGGEFQRGALARGRLRGRGRGRFRQRGEGLHQHLHVHGALRHLRCALHHHGAPRAPLWPVSPLA